MNEKSVVRGATVIVIDDVLTGKKVFLIIHKDGAWIPQVDLNDVSAARSVSTSELVVYFESQRSSDPVLVDFILGEIRKIHEVH
jgi:hypothetical protein